MNFIEFYDDELIDFFINEPIFIGEYEGGELIFYDTDKVGIKLCLTIDTYSKYINLSMSYNEISIFEGDIHKVDKIVKKSDIIYIYIENKKIIKISRINNLFRIFLEI
ncbi:hypothetical protein [[Clostridium] colinum]|uniref:hypothetical protein n=1 Tax=[Clostridium] colinum TaxID=36835 RepID=UPI002024C05D|nr:hypothetical protein [[Clostridium] colinum]